MMLSLDAQGFPLWQGTLLNLPPKERAVLALLIARAGEVVSKQAFAELAWKGRAMSDESLARCISGLRRTLPGVALESVYGAGYRLVAEPQAGHARLLAAAQAAPQAVETHLHARSLAQRRTPAAMQRALTLLRALVLAHPRYASARVTLAETLAAAASWGLLSGNQFVDEGLAQLDEAWRIDPHTPSITTYRAWLLDLAWRFDEAELHYEASLAAAPHDADTLFLHGWHRLVMGQPEAAAERFRQAIVLQPHAPLLRAMLARALTHAGQWDAALVELQATFYEHPDNTIAAIFRIGLLAASRPDAALADRAWQLAEQRDAPPYALAILSYVLARCARPDEARSLIDACLACSASSACTAAMHAAACVALGDHERAAQLIVGAFDARCAVLPMLLRDPGNAALHSHPQISPLSEAVFGTGASRP